MMLPSALPMAQKIVELSELPSNRDQRLLIQTAFLLAYFRVWMGFSLSMVIAQLIIDHGLHSVTHHAQATINALVLIGVGLFQFTALKKACLQGCRSIGAFVAQHYQRGWQGGWNIGLQHGLYCLGCCWALMVGCAVIGMENLFNMILFTAVMTLERLWQYGETLAVWTGAALVVVGMSYFVVLVVQ